MSREDTGGLTVWLDHEDMQHLLTHGTAVVSKEVGPIEVKIKTEQKLRTNIVMEGPNDDPEVVE